MTTEASLKSFSERARKTKALRKGFVAFRLGGADGGNYFLDCSPGQAKLLRGAPADRPLIELIGDAEKIIPMLEGKEDARTLFLAGGFRVRGDLRYVSDFALDLGLLKHPL